MPPSHVPPAPQLPFKAAPFEKRYHVNYCTRQSQRITVFPALGRHSRSARRWSGTRSGQDWVCAGHGDHHVGVVPSTRIMSPKLIGSHEAASAVGADCMPPGSRAKAHLTVRHMALAAVICASVTLKSGSPLMGLPFASASAAHLPGWAAAACARLPPGAGTALAGLAAGLLHTLAGPDHLAALAPLTVGRGALASSALGALWGCGHSTGQLILGLAMVLLKDRFEMLVPALSRWGGVSVGVTLTLIGALGLRETLEATGDAAGGKREGAVGGGGSGGPGTEINRQGRSWLTTFATGIVYGLQPDALFVILPALTLPDRVAAASYMITFVLGTVLAMGGYAGIIGITSQKIAEKSASGVKRLSAVASGLALAVGVFILVPALKSAVSGGAT